MRGGIAAPKPKKLELKCEKNGIVSRKESLEDGKTYLCNVSEGGEGESRPEGGKNSNNRRGMSHEGGGNAAPKPKKLEL